MAATPIVGQRYRNLDVKSWNAEWIINAIFTGTDTLRYADLRSASDRTDKKTLALSVVADTNRFMLIETAARVPVDHPEV